MSKIVRVVATIIVPFILLYGLYLIVHGHLTPGGGFQGGAVIASGIALLFVAFNFRYVRGFLSEDSLSTIECSGALLFVGIAFGGIVTTTFFANFLLGSPVFGGIPVGGPEPATIWSGGTIPLMNIAVGMKVSAGLLAIIFMMWFAASKEEGDQNE